MEALQFSCPRCNRLLGCEGERAGQPGRCPACDHAFLAPQTLMGGRHEAGGDFVPGEGKVAAVFEDKGAFEALEADETLEEEREAKELRKQIAREQRKTKWRLRFEKSALVAVLGVCAILVGQYIWSTWKSRKTAAAVEVVELSSDDVDSERERIKATQDLAERFLEADRFEERTKLVRDVERVAPLMREYYQRRGFGREPYKRLVDRSETGGEWLYFDMAGFQYLLVEMEDFSVRVLVVEETEEGVKVDWESWVIYGEMEWPDFKAMRPSESVLMRPIVTKFDYYNFDFIDPERWSCYRLVDPILGDMLYGYVETGSELDLRLTGLVARKGTAWPAIKLRWPEESKSDHQVEIVELVSERWVID